MKIWRCGLLAAIAMMVFMGMGMTSMAQTLPDGTEFDAEYYASHNPDVVAAFGDDPEALLNHYLMYGKAEGRNGAKTLEEQTREMEQEMLQLINANRSEAGTGGLSLDGRLCRAAQIRAKEMADNQYLAHSRPDGSDIFSVYGEVGFEFHGYYHYGENIAFGHRSVEEVMTGWMHSPGHRANILQQEYHLVGVGRYEKYWVQLFAS